MSITEINSNHKFVDIEQHFRISAGPGAGKTHWLISHMKNILSNSDRLGKTRKIACITYTNIAVETILNRLGTSVEQVEVSTIHSFLYRHIIKPYAWLIAGQYDLNISKMDGHDEFIFSTYKLKNWLENHSNRSSFTNPCTFSQLLNLQTNKQALVNWLTSISYKLNDQKDLIITHDRSQAFYIQNSNRRFIRSSCLDNLESDLLDFKKQYWREGTLHHIDILFFGYQIIRNHPFILDVIRAKFPYFFVDEFQDSNPIQVEIVKLIGQTETKVGIIGDKAQSIYGFQGAVPSQFDSFSLPNLIDLKMKDNRRSNNQIIDVLNHIRPEFEQNKHRNQVGVKPIILVGDSIASLREAEGLVGEEALHSLSFKNITANAMKREVEGVNLKNTLFDDLKKADSNRNRTGLITACIKSIEHAREGKFKDAIKELQRMVGKDDKGKKRTLSYLSFLLPKYDEYKNGTVMNFYDLLKSNIDNTLSRFRAGRAKTFYESNNYQDMALCVKVTEGKSCHKTIHKSKGDEFDNVLVNLEKERELEFILNPDLNGKEEHRVKYVAVSRAKERLFISVPTLTQENKDRLTNLFDVAIL